LTILGEYVLPTRGGVWQETLVGALNALEHKPHAARQALARSITGGWLSTERRGRRSRVQLTRETADMLRSGADRIYHFGLPWEWEGHWLLVVLRVPEDRREVRHHVRTQLAWAGFGSLGNGLWITPHVEREGELPAMAGADSVAELEGVADTYQEFIDRFRGQRPKTPEAVFRAQTELVHEWRKFPFVDPDLPEEMLPSGWPRSAARQVFEDRHAAWHEPAQEYFRSLEGLGNARVPKPAA
jgi:phenylacetic acid degradation operon negative regulatory protein